MTRYLLILLILLNLSNVWCITQKFNILVTPNFPLSYCIIGTESIIVNNNYLDLQYNFSGFEIDHLKKSLQSLGSDTVIHLKCVDHENMRNQLRIQSKDYYTIGIGGLTEKDIPNNKKFFRTFDNSLVLIQNLEHEVLNKLKYAKSNVEPLRNMLFICLTVVLLSSCLVSITLQDFFDENQGETLRNKNQSLGKVLKIFFSELTRRLKWLVKQNFFIITFTFYVSMIVLMYKSDFESLFGQVFGNNLESQPVQRVFSFNQNRSVGVISDTLEQLKQQYPNNNYVVVESEFNYQNSVQELFKKLISDQYRQLVVQRSLAHYYAKLYSYLEVVESPIIQPKSYIALCSSDTPNIVINRIQRNYEELTNTTTNYTNYLERQFNFPTPFNNKLKIQKELEYLNFVKIPQLDSSLTGVVIIFLSTLLATFIGIIVNKWVSQALKNSQTLLVYSKIPVQSQIQIKIISQDCSQPLIKSNPDDFKFKKSI